MYSLDNCFNTLLGYKSYLNRSKYSQMSVEVEKLHANSRSSQPIMTSLWDIGNSGNSGDQHKFLKIGNDPFVHPI